MKTKLLLASIATTFISGGVVADEYPNFETYIGGAYYHHDGDRSFDGAISLEGGIELPVNEMMSFETWLSGYEVERKNGSSEFDALRINPGLLFHLCDGKVRPFISAGFSHLEYETSSNDEHSESLINLGLGVKKYYDSNLIMRGELLAMNSFDNEMLDYGARIAVGYAFGRSVSTPIVEDVQPNMVSNNEMSGEEVLLTNTKVPFVDSDNDGVADSSDKCPSTEPAFQVDENGCPVMLTEKVSIQLDVKFPSNSSILSKDNYSEIEQVAKFMKQFDKTSVTVEGYTDDRGADEYNKSLSQRRADAVKQVLIEKFGIAKERVNSVGYGEESPIADNSTAEGRAENRRVVAVIESTIERSAVK